VPTSATRPTPRAEPVGSLLRPPHLKAAFERIFDRHSSHTESVLDDHERAELEELHALADEAIGAAVARQVAIGLDVLTDGEMRRAHYVNSLFDGVTGVAENDEPEYFAGDDDVAPPPEPIADAPLAVRTNPLAREASFLSSITTHPWKVAIQTPSSFYFPAARYNPEAYESRDAFVDNVVDVVRQLVSGAVAAGARYIQFDYPLFPALADPDKRDELRAGSEHDLDTIFDKAIAVDNAVLEAVPEGVTAALHVCRGNFRSHWWARGSLEPVAERMFNELRHERFLVEWDDVEREGDYSPLRFVPSGPSVVMGLVSSKVGRLEDEDEVVRSLEECARYLEVEQLAVSPQCGFASAWHGNEITEDEQWRKLELVSRVADRVWPRA
jgi:5-methyltetrahydropteroyltriglutamate--homocysteine methyltransferase